MTKTVNLELKDVVISAYYLFLYLFCSPKSARFARWPLSAQATQFLHLKRTRASMRTLILATR